MYTIRNLMNSSSDSYLSSIDLMKVTETLLHLTNPKNVLRKQRQFVSFFRSSYSHALISKHF